MYRVFDSENVQTCYSKLIANGPYVLNDINLLAQIKYNKVYEHIFYRSIQTKIYYNMYLYIYMWNMFAHAIYAIRCIPRSVFPPFYFWPYDDFFFLYIPLHPFGPDV